MATELCNTSPWAERKIPELLRIRSFLQRPLQRWAESCSSTRKSLREAVNNWKENWRLSHTDSLDYDIGMEEEHT